MDFKTFISVYSVGEDGSTGDRLGGGLLVEPLVVAVDADVVGRFEADGRPPALRVATMPAGGLGAPEVIDVDKLAELPGGIIVLALSHSPTAPTAVLDDRFDDDDRLEDRERYLRALGEAVETVPRVQLARRHEYQPMSLMCRLFGIGCPKKGKG